MLSGLSLFFALDSVDFSFEFDIFLVTVPYQIIVYKYNRV